MIKDNTYFSSNHEDSTQALCQQSPSSYLRAWSFRKFEKLLLSIVLIELLLGGNGYITEIGGIRLRVWLYMICMSCVAFNVFSKRRLEFSPLIIALFFSFLAVVAFGTVVGTSHGISLETMTGELQGMFYFPMLLFFAIAIKDRADIHLISRLIVVCGIIQALCYLSLLLTMYSDFISALDVHQFLGKNSEFIFRHHPRQTMYVGFFYKGFFHLGVATLFLLFQPGKKKMIWALVTIIALALSLTRGVMLAAMITSFFGLFLMNNKRYVFVSLIVLFFGAFSQYESFQYENIFLKEVSGKQSIVVSSKSTTTAKSRVSDTLPFAGVSFFDGLNSLLRPTDKIRILDLQAALNQSNLSTIFIGNGIGSPIGSRQRVEIIFLEIFCKQGIIGLLFWLSLLVSNFFLFFKLDPNKKPEALPFLLSSLFVYLASSTNNFLTGSIGMSIVLICIVVLTVISKKDYGILYNKI